MSDWCDIDSVQRQLGPTVRFTADPAAPDVVAAANAWARRRRVEAGYTDDPAPAPAPSADVALGAALYAVSLWRERASTESFASFNDLQSFGTVGSYGRIRQLLGIGKAAVDSAPTAEQLAAAWRRRRRRSLR